VVNNNFSAAKSGKPSGKPAWVKTVAKYQHSQLRISITQILNSFVPYILTWVLAYLLYPVSPLLTVFFGAVGGLFVIRIFIIQHDCGHNSFFKSKKWNNRLGSICGVISLTPYEYWRHSHAQHHATSGDLDFRGFGDVWTLTAREWAEAGALKRVGYRLYRNPLIMFVLGPLFMFLVNQRSFISIWRVPNRRAAVNMILTDLAIFGSVIALSLIGGVDRYLLTHLPQALVAGTCGVWLFFIQHNFEETYWRYHPQWDYTAAALEGSSFYKLPKLLQWITGNIGFHHIHHLSPKIPNYLLEQCHNENPEFQNVPTLTLWGSFDILRKQLKLWDVENNRMIGFREARELYTKPRAAKRATA
jgi:omega-6 fatty acid desaturase (delta-12 desaturase)